MRTAYSYDGAGRLEYETVTREAGGTTNPYKTQYAYTWIAAGSGGGRQLIRTEQAYSGGAWANDNKLTYSYDALERQYFEQRHDWALGAWAARFDTTQEYDKNGNRTRYHRNTAANFATSYGQSEDLSYTYNSVNSLTAAADADVASYSAAFTCDPNGNITQVDESEGLTDTLYGKSALHTYFDYDALNRLSAHRTKAWNTTQGDWRWTKRSHSWDGLGRLVASNYKQWWDQGSEPSGDSLEHVYAGSRHVQNYDGTSTYGAVWHWAGASNDHGGPLRSPNADTASQTGYNIAEAGGAGTPQRRSFVNPTTEGNKREFYAQGRPEAKDASGDGANWYLGTQSQPRASTMQGTTTSRFFFTGTVSATDMSRATDKREKDRIGVFGSSNSYAGSYGRVTSEPIGRDLNPLGRGDGQAYVGGAVSIGRLSAVLPGGRHFQGTGTSVNNEDASDRCDCSECRGLGSQVDKYGLLFDASQCDPPGCLAVFCNEGCYMGWISGEVGVCCKDPRLPCVGPIAVEANSFGQVGLTAAVISATSSRLHPLTSGCCSSTTPMTTSPTDSRRDFDEYQYYSREECMQSGHCWDCCCKGGPEGPGPVSGASKPPNVPTDWVLFDSSCDSLNEGQKSGIRAAFVSACGVLADCRLGSGVGACLSRVCGGPPGTVKVYCKAQPCDFDLMTKEVAGSGCLGARNVSIYLCLSDKMKSVLNSSAILSALAGHELLHFCDCAVDVRMGRIKHQCEVAEYADEKRSRAEGYAESCMRCCFSTSGKWSGYTFPNRKGQDDCCLCEECWY